MEFQHIRGEPHCVLDTGNNFEYLWSWIPNLSIFTSRVAKQQIRIPMNFNDVGFYDIGYQ